MKTQIRTLTAIITIFFAAFTYGQDDFNIREGNSYKIYFGIENFVEGKVLQIDSEYIRIQQLEGTVKIQKSQVKRVTAPGEKYIRALTVIELSKADMNTVQKTEDCTISYYDTAIVDSVTMKTGLRLKEVEDINRVIFLTNDSMIVTDETGKSQGIALERSKSIRIDNGNNGGIGIAIGCLTGFTISYIASTWAGFGLSVLAGGVIGGIIGFAIKSYDEVDLQKHKVSDRKVEIIRIIRANKEY